MSKYVFCDLDNTLLDDNKNVSKDDYLAIKKFEDKGNHFVICSGRVPFALKTYKDLLKSTEVISSNGALIISGNKIIKKEVLSKEQIIPIVNYALNNNLNLRLFAQNYLYIFNHQYASKRAFVYKEKKDVDKDTIFSLIDKVEIIKMAFTSDDEALLNKTKKDIEKLELNTILTFSANNFLEVNAINQTKGNGIKDYCKFNNINIKDTVSIGDNDNDIAMLKTTSYSACPSNAIKEVKNIVNYICENDNNHSAIKEVLNKIN